MHILVICESEKKARIHSRRIVSKYLPQLGSQVWFGAISEDGAKELYKELLKKSTKNMSVICHRITSRTTSNIYFLVGSRKCFDEKGHYAFSFQKTNVENTELEENHFISLLKLIGKLSGLFHDLGKSITSFQKKIRGLRASNSITDPVRHDILSAFVVLQIIKTFEKENEIEILQHLQDFKKDDWNNLISITFNNVHAAHSAGNPEQSFNKVNKYLLKDKHIQKFPILLSVLQIIMGHHFLPKSCKHKHKLLPDKYFHKYDIDSHGEEPLSIYGNPVWNEEKWQHSVSDVTNEIIDFLSNYSHIVPEAPVLMLYNKFIVRPALVAADQNVSANGKKEVYEKDDIDCVPFANPYDSKNLNGQMAQPLADHLIQVGRETQKNVRKLYALWKGRHLDFVDKIPKNLKSNITHEQFAWQRKAQDIGKNINKLVGTSDFPFFGVMTSSTGSGKTRCIPRFMSHLQGEGNIRFTLALGLRTLTIQSGQNYIDENEIGFKGNQDVSVLVGGSFYDFANESRETSKNNDDKQQNVQLNDTDESISEYVNIADQIIGGLDGAYIEPDSPFPKELAGTQGGNDWNGQSAKKAKMLQVPILVCTIDHIMAGLINPKADASKILTRIITSDLVIDEIDCFDIQDLQAIMQLVFYTAAAGKKVLISSATTSPKLCKALFQQYITGYEFYSKTNSKASNQIYTAWLNDNCDLCHYDKIAINERAVDKYFQKTQNIFKHKIEKLKNEPIKRKHDFLDISDCIPKNDKDNEEIQQAYYNISKKISSQIDCSHRHYHVTQNGKNLSVGIIRITYTKHAYRIFDSLFDINSDIGANRYYLFYQSQLENENLENIEYILNKMLKRKSNKTEDDPIWKHEGIKNILRDNPSINDFQIIIVSTPIEETGRDHDFDWGIVEPTSIWSTIQMAGRIFRHRLNFQLTEDDPPNIITLSHTFREVFSSKMRPYEKPGPIDKYHSLNTYDARLIFPEGMKEVIDSRYVMSEHKPKEFCNSVIEYDNLTEIEQDRIEHDLINKIIDEKIFSEKFVIYLSNKYNELFPFRDSSGKININIYHKNDKFTYIYYWGKSKYTGEILSLTSKRHYNNYKLLLPQFGIQYKAEGESQLSIYSSSKNLGEFHYGENLLYNPVIGYVLIH